MDVKASEWRLAPSLPNVCRCCLAEGCYKDISTEYFWMGKREVYAEMLTETFDITIAYAQSAGLNSHSRLICEACISRLRDASEFKKQVHECEKTFLQHLDPGRPVVSVEECINEKDLKLEEVKQEMKISDDEGLENDDLGGFDNTNDDDYDDLDDEPLTKFASKKTEKESVDSLDLIDNTKVTEKRKSTSKVKASPTKKAKTSKVIIKASSSKASTKTDKKKKEQSDPSRTNAEIIIRNTTAYPFRVNDKTILCVFCRDLFENGRSFREHMEKDHESFNLNVAFHNLPKLEFIKADIADLRCRICSEKFSDLDNIAKHLKLKHSMRVIPEEKLGIMPYSLQVDTHKCTVCDKSLPSLYHLNRHTITHFLGYVCHVCGSSYVSSTGLLRHERSRHQDYEVLCKKCNKVFPNMEAKQKHRSTDKMCFPYSCTKCTERFLNYRTRRKHLESVHGVSIKCNTCVRCDVSFASDVAYYEHFKVTHTAESMSCKYCGLRFSRMSRLKRHLMKHRSA